MENYEKEAKQKWGETEAYKEYEQKPKSEKAAIGMEAIFANFAKIKQSGASYDSMAAQGAVKQLQDYITEYYYTCTTPILAGLGQMYVADNRFKNTIDKNGEGTAEYVFRAIMIYCKK